MRRFRIIDSTGDVRGEGVQFSDGEVAIHDPSRARNFYPHHFGVGLNEDGMDLSPLEHMLSRSNEWAGRDVEVSITWIDPE